jgi:hypothetical protein
MWINQCCSTCVVAKVAGRNFALIREIDRCPCLDLFAASSLQSMQITYVHMNDSWLLQHKYMRGKHFSFSIFQCLFYFKGRHVSNSRGYIYTYIIFCWPRLLCNQCRPHMHVHMNDSWLLQHKYMRGKHFSFSIFQCLFYFKGRHVSNSRGYIFF